MMFTDDSAVIAHSSDDIQSLVDSFTRPASQFGLSSTLGKLSAYTTTAVKRLNRYFCFLLLGFHLPVREKWAKMYKSVSQHIFLKIVTFFR